MAGTTNFDFLQEHDPIFVQLAAAAERSFISDPNTTLIKLRQLGEAIAQDLAARCNTCFDDRTTQLELQQQIENLCNSDPSAYVTTMMDYYKFPDDFPGLGDIKDVVALPCVQKIEQALSADIGTRNFIPNLMLHEFEALLFCAPEKFGNWIDEAASVQQLIQIKQQFDSPEYINNDPNTAPSKRNLGLIPRQIKFGLLRTITVKVEPSDRE